MSFSYGSLNVRFGMTVSMFRKYVIGMTPVIMFFMRPSEKPGGKYVETNAMKMAEKICMMNKELRGGITGDRKVSQSFNLPDFEPFLENVQPTVHGPNLPQRFHHYIFLRYKAPFHR